MYKMQQQLGYVFLNNTYLYFLLPQTILIILRNIREGSKNIKCIDSNKLFTGHHPHYVQDATTAGFLCQTHDFLKTLLNFASFLRNIREG